ncbi:MAG: tetratricopeptide repeat protein [candidate division Zixibacteria bacterium]|nr:tetratricopeptide repeat protein [candidate division Zixibacteria bacterium]
MKTFWKIVCLWLAFFLPPSFGESGSAYKRVKAEELYGDGVALYLKGDYGHAIGVLASSIASDTTFSIAYNALGMAYLKLRQWQNAENVLRKAIQLDTAYAFAYYNLAEVVYSNPLSSEGQTRESIQLLRKALLWEKDPLQLQKVRIMLGNYLYSIGEVTTAAEEYRAAVKYDSTDLAARLGLANTAENSAEAYAEINRILKIDSTFAPALLALANISLMNNRYGEAIGIYYRELQRDSTQCLKYIKCLEFIDYYLNKIIDKENYYFSAAMKQNAY